MILVVKVTKVRQHRLWLRFSNGREGVRDFSDLFAKAAQWSHMACSAIQQQQHFTCE
jgi:hypothetical protein